jgi:hypothetical protein
VNPYETLAAVVEDDGRTVYLYLYSVQDQERRFQPVWVANRLPAAEKPDQAAMREGIAPLMPRGDAPPPGRARTGSAGAVAGVV